MKRERSAGYKNAKSREWCVGHENIKKENEALDIQNDPWNQDWFHVRMVSFKIFDVSIGGRFELAMCHEKSSSMACKVWAANNIRRILQKIWDTLKDAANRKVEIVCPWCFTKENTQQGWIWRLWEHHRLWEPIFFLGIIFLWEEIYIVLSSFKIHISPAI